MAEEKLTELVARGANGTVEFAVRASGACPALDFFENDCEQIRAGGKEKPESTARARFAVLFQARANSIEMSAKRFKKEMGKFFAFRHEVRGIQIRFPCFQDGTKWIVTHGFCKPGSKKGLGNWPDSEVQKADDIRKEYFARKQAIEKARDNS